MGQAANRRKVILFKNAEGSGVNFQEELQKKIASADPEVLKRVSAVMKQHLSTLKQEDSAAAGSVVNAVARLLTPMKDQIPADLMVSVLKEIGFSGVSKEIGNEGSSGAMSVGTGGEGEEMIAPEELEKAATAAQKAYKEHLEKLGHRDYPDAQIQMKSKSGEPGKPKEDDKVEKSAKLDAETQSKLDAIFKSHELIQKAYEDQKKENGELKSEIAALHSVNAQKELITKAAGWTHLPLSQADVVATLSDAQKASKESFDRIVKMYDTMNEQNRVAKSFGGNLFSETGSGLPAGGQGGDTTWSRIEKAASALVLKSADGQELSQAEKVAKFLETPDGLRMYAEHQAGRKDGI